MTSSMNFLHIDDDADTRLLLQELLAEGTNTAEDGVEMQVFGASGIEEAVARYGQSPLDAILLDHRLGGVEGIELLPRLRLHWACPVWILTGLPTETLVERSAQVGAAGVVAKNKVLECPTHLRAFLLDCKLLVSGTDKY